ncbi:helix-turn-helix domain-containing protein [Nocardioides marmoraquaticus]
MLTDTARTTWGVSPATVLAGTHVDADRLEERHSTIASKQQFRAVRNVVGQGPDPLSLGVSVGLGTSLTQLGLFGFAVMASPTIRELIAMALRYFSLTTLVLTVDLHEDAEGARLVLGDSHLPDDVRPYFVGRDATGIATVVLPFLGTTLERYGRHLVVALRHDDSPLATTLSQFSVGAIEVTESDRLEVRFPTALLDEPLPQADRHTVQTCLEQCERLLQRRSARSGLTAQVRTQLLADTRIPATCDEIAAALSVHPRTLRRHLADEGTSYRRLLNEVRSGLAAELLTEVGLTVEQVSLRLGYTETAAFSRAFSRWYGVPPSRYRRLDAPRPSPQEAAPAAPPRTSHVT